MLLLRQKSFQLLVLILTYLSANAQKDTLRISLQQALDYAVDNRIELKNATIQENVAQNQVQQAYSTLYPRINGILDARDNFVLPTTFIPNFANLSSGERLPLKIGTKYNFTAAIEFNQPLFDATIFPGLKVAKLNHQLQSKNTEVQKENIKLGVYQSYYTVLLNKEKLSLSNKNLQRNKKSYDDAKVRFDNGALLKSDLDKLYLDLKNSESIFKRGQNTLRLSEDDLKKTLNLPKEQALALTDKLNSESVRINEGLSYQKLNETSFAENRSDYQAQEIQKQMTQLSVRQAQNEYYPKLKLYGYLAEQGFSNSITLNKWCPYTYAGLRLDVPIFDGFKKKHDVDALVFQSHTTQNNLEKLKIDVDYEVKSAWVTLQTSQDNLTLWEGNIKMAEDIVKLNEVRSSEGAITSSDLINSEATLKDTQTNYMIALYDYLVAKVNWQKALGEL